MSLARTLFTSAVLSALVAAPASADPAAWSRSKMTAAASYFPTHATAMVVAVGDTAQPAAAALLAALQASETLELATDARALGKVDKLSDGEIVKRAFATPIKRVAIVRAFPAANNGVKAVVTIYAAEGQVAAAFTLVPGRDLAENPRPTEATDGVARDELQSVTSSIGTGTGDGNITYTRQQIVGVSAYGLMQIDSVTFAQNGKPLSDTPALYEAVGMHAEARSYRSDLEAHDKWTFRGGMMALGGLTGLIGFGTYALVAGASDSYSSTGTQGQDDHTLAWGLTAASAGLLVLGIVEAVEHPAPRSLTSDEAIALADKHNAKQKQSIELHFAPVATPTGGGFVLGGSW
jgi:hypothetical protein